MLSVPTILGINLETYISAPLPKCGVYRYVDAAFSEAACQRAKELTGLENP